jgi:hypothetical protein
MLKNFFVLKIIKIINLLPVFFLASSCVVGQVRDNLEIFYTLIDSSGENVITDLPVSVKDIDVNFNLGNSYSLFENHLMSVFNKKGYKINFQSSAVEKIFINYVLDQAKVKYGDIFRSGLFGSYFLPRTIEITGNYSIKDSSFLYKEFNYNYTDTVRVDNVKTLENNSYPFTQAPVPSEPFFSSLFEPLVAIGTAAIAVFLFFTIRSK